MNWKKFENWLQNKLNNYQSPVDVPSVWKNIETDIDLLNKKNQSKSGFYLAFSVLGIALLALLSYSLFFSEFGVLETSINPKKLDKTASLSQENNKAIKDISKQNTKAFEPKTEKKEAENKSSNSLANQQEEIQSNLNIGDKTKPKNTIIDDSPENKAFNAANSKTKQEDDFAKPQSSNAILNIGDKTKPKNTIIDDSSENKAFNVANSKTKQRDDLAKKSKKDTTEISKTKSQIQFSSQEKNTLLSEVQEQDFIKQENRIDSAKRHLSKIDLLLLSPIQFQPIEQDKGIANRFSFNHIQTISSNQQTKPFSFGIGLVAGIGYAHKKLGDKNNDSDSLLQLRKNSETSLEISQLGLQFTLAHKSGWELSTGLQRTAIAERLDYNRTKIETEMVEGILHYRTNLDGVLEPIYGLIPLTRTTITKKKVYNQYELYDIPVLIAYHQNIGKWQVGLQGGILANLMLQTRGQVIQKNLESIDIDMEQNNIFKSKIGLSYQLGLSIRRTILPNLALSFSPTFRYFANDFTVQEYGLSQKYWLMSGVFGVTYKLGKR